MFHLIIGTMFRPKRYEFVLFYSCYRNVLLQRYYLVKIYSIPVHGIFSILLCSRTDLNVYEILTMTSLKTTGLKKCLKTSCCPLQKGLRNL